MASGNENGKMESGKAPYTLESCAASRQPNKFSLKLYSSYEQLNKSVKSSDYIYSK